MSTDLAKIQSDVMAMDDMDTVARAWLAVMNAKAMVKQVEAKLKERAKEIMVRDNLEGIQLADTIKIILARKTKNRYDTPTIYKALGFTQEQMDVLPKSPEWRKTAILANPKTAGAWYEDIKDVVEAKELDEKFIPKQPEKKP